MDAKLSAVDEAREALLEVIVSPGLASLHRVRVDRLIAAVRAECAGERLDVERLDVERLGRAMHLLHICCDDHAPGATAHGLSWPEKLAAKYAALREKQP